MKGYEKEARERWGGTEAFREYEKRGKDDAASAQGLMKIFNAIGKLKDLPADDPSVQTEISGLQKYITDNYYTCTDEILLGLGETYSADARFRESIDKAGGEGCAEFVSEAIRVRKGG